MGFRFHRSVRIIPGIRLNFSKSGVSTSIGGHGATVNLSKKGTRTTVGIPGSGLSYSTLTPHTTRPASLVGGTTARSSGAGWVVGIGAVLILGLIGLFTASPPGTPTVLAAPVEPVATSYVTALSLNCRSVGGPTGSIVKTLDKGTAVTTTATANGWSKVSSTGAADCWALSQFLSSDAPTSPATAASPLVGTVGSRHHARNLALSAARHWEPIAHITTASRINRSRRWTAAARAASAAFAADLSAADTASRATATNATGSDIGGGSDGRP